MARPDAKLGGLARAAATELGGETFGGAARHVGEALEVFGARIARSREEIGAKLGERRRRLIAVRVSSADLLGARPASVQRGGAVTRRTERETVCRHDGAHEH
jgi:hypothetical protein